MLRCVYYCERDVVRLFSIRLGARVHVHVYLFFNFSVAAASCRRMILFYFSIFIFLIWLAYVFAFDAIFCFRLWTRCILRLVYRRSVLMVFVMRRFGLFIIYILLVVLYFTYLFKTLEKCFQHIQSPNNHQQS